MASGLNWREKSIKRASFILSRRLVVVFSEMLTSFAISDISVLAPDNNKYFIILKSVSLRSVDTDCSLKVTLITVAGLRRSFSDWLMLLSNGLLMIRAATEVLPI